ncbi:hypothetical protein U1Q18_003680 [Sarracenia purpurea var. burkii]
MWMLESAIAMVVTRGQWRHKVIGGGCEVPKETRETQERWWRVRTMHDDGERRGREDIPQERGKGNDGNGRDPTVEIVMPTVWVSFSTC